MSKEGPYLTHRVQAAVTDLEKSGKEVFGIQEILVNLPEGTLGGSVGRVLSKMNCVLLAKDSPKKGWGSEHEILPVGNEEICQNCVCDDSGSSGCARRDPKLLNPE